MAWDLDRSRALFFIMINGRMNEFGEAKNQRYIILSVLTSGIPLFFLVDSQSKQDFRLTFNTELLNSLTLRVVLDDNYKPDAMKISGYFCSQNLTTSRISIRLNTFCQHLGHPTLT